MALSNKQQNNRKTLKWICGCSKKSFFSVLMITVMSSVISLSSIGLALFSKEVLDISTGVSKGSFFVCGALLLGLVVVQILIVGADNVLRQHVLEKLKIAFRSRLFTAVSRRKYSEVCGYHSGDLLNRVTSDTDIVVSGVLNIIPSLVSMLTQIVGGMATLIVLDWKISCIILILGLSVPALGRIFNRRFKTLHKDSQSAEGKVRSFIQECFENVVVIKTFSGEAPFFKKLNEFMRENYKIRMKKSYISTFTHLSLYSFFTLGYYAVMIWGAAQISGNVMTYGTLMAFLQIVSQLRAPLQNISGIMPQYYATLASAERLIEMENGEWDSPSAETERLKEISHNFRSLELNKVTFAYDDELVLDNAEFTVNRGKITAITGESGSGKSTIFKIILGLYEPQSGNITINGETVLDTSLRGLLAYVPQGNLVLSGTVRENITLFNNEISDEALEKAAKAAEIYDYIDSLPNRFDTVLSERGAGLSEGQIQRISIARALLLDTPILLLDEATSALDEETETKVLENIQQLNDKAVLFVTHRNTSLKICDTIVHCENKKFRVIKE